MSLEQEVIDKVNECFKLASVKYNVDFNIPVIDFKKRGVCAGMAYLYNNRLSFNKKLLEDNYHEFIKQTVPHEVAHFVAYKIYNDAKHKNCWKSVMKQCFGLQPKIYHNYDTSSVKKTYKYRCVCMTHYMGIRQHNKMLKGFKYQCKICFSILEKI